MMRLEDGPSIVSNVFLVDMKTRRLLEHIHNTCTEVHRQQYATFLSGTAVTSPNYIALGNQLALSSESPEQFTALKAEVYRKIVDSPLLISPTTARLLAIFDLGAGTGELKEFGLFDAAATQAAIHACLIRTTRVTTEEGHTNLGDVRVGSRVLGHDGHYHEVLRHFVLPYLGTLYRIKRVGWPDSIDATPDHPFLAYRWPKLQWIMAKDLREGDRLVSPRVSAHGRSPTVIQVKKVNHRHPKAKQIENICLDEDVAWLLGLYTAEGSNAAGRALVLSLGTHEKDLISQARLVLVDKFGLHVGIEELSSNSTNLRVSSTVLGEVFGELCGRGAKNKHVPYLILQASRKIKRAYLAGLLAGDGHVYSEQAQTIATASLRLAEDLTMLLLDIGYAPLFYKTTRVLVSGRIVPQYLLSYGDNKHKRGYSWIRRRHALYRIRKIETVPFNGKVYNLEVAGSNSFVANGISTHNCDATTSWTTGANIALTLDTTDYREGTGAILATASASAGTVIYDHAALAKNLSAYATTDYLQFWLALSAKATCGAVTVKLGNDASNYWYWTWAVADLTDYGATLVWNWFSKRPADATGSVGSPVMSSTINYFDVATANAPAAADTFRLDNIRMFRQAGNLWARAEPSNSLVKTPTQMLGVYWLLSMSIGGLTVAYQTFAKEELAVSTAVVTLTSTVYSPAGAEGAKQATINVVGGDIRFWMDGSTPTSTVGVLGKQNTFITVGSYNDIVNFKAIRDSGTSAATTIEVHFQR